LSAPPHASICPRASGRATVPVVDGQGRVVNAIFASPTETRTAIGPDGSNYTGLSGSPASRLPGADWFGFVAPNTGRDLVVSKDFAFADINRTESYNAALHLDWDLDWAKVVSVSDYKKFDKNFVMCRCVSDQPRRIRDQAKTGSFSQELRIAGSSDKLTWSARSITSISMRVRRTGSWRRPVRCLRVLSGRRRPGSTLSIRSA
jgi:iron complex outermembrane receptor protein